MKRQLSEAQLSVIRRKCLNGVCAMTPEERKARKKVYRARVMEDPFRREKYAEYFRKRRAKPGIRERENEQARTRYNADKEKARSYNREKYRRMVSDPERHAAYKKRRRERCHGPDGRMTAARKRQQILWQLIPRWERVVADGREEAYLRRTTEENARLFRMWRYNGVLFDEMIRRSYAIGKGGLK